jgi:hypothetical protein
VDDCNSIPRVLDKRSIRIVNISAFLNFLMQLADLLFNSIFKMVPVTLQL